MTSELVSGILLGSCGIRELATVRHFIILKWLRG
jgi:hypothetical protein